MSKVDRASHGPGWLEVFFGAVLSLLLGVVLGAILMVLRPVATVKELPKEPVEGTIYYVEGRRGDTNRAKQALAKRKAFVEGKSIKVTEDEINALAVGATAAKPAPAPAKPGAAPAKPAEKPAEVKSATIVTGTPNVRIRDGVMQVGVPVTLNVLGLEQQVIAQARGGFEKDGALFKYEPTELYLGSCPVQRLPFLGDYIRQQVIAAHPVPDDIAGAWAKLASVSIEENTLTLTMP